MTMTDDVETKSSEAVAVAAAMPNEPDVAVKDIEQQQATGNQDDRDNNEEGVIGSKKLDDRTSLHGLESTMGRHRDSDGDAAKSYKDYLKAQKALQSRRWLMEHHHTSTGQIIGEKDNQRRGSIIINNSSINKDDSNHNNDGIQDSAGAPTEDERKLIRRLSLIGRRSSISASASAAVNNATAMHNNVAWDDIFHQLEAIDEDGHFHDNEEHVIPFYSPPIQRQRWGQDQVLPHIDWGCLFFDLFYVAAAYNMGGMLISALNTNDYIRGVIYFVGIFGPLYTTWETSMYYESRYTMVDYAHRLFDALRFLFVSVAVLHIKPLELLGDPSSAEVLLFISAIFVESLMHLGLNVELYVNGQGDRAAIRNHTLVKIKYQLAPTILTYLVSLIVAAIQFAKPPQDEGDYDDYNSTSKHRFLAEEATTAKLLWELSDLPLTLTSIAYLMNIFHTTWRKMRATSGKHGDIRQRFVPNNVDYVVHRYGEWILLMIGESILSLLIVETTESKEYYIITTFGVITIIILQILKFESEPSHAEDHAMWGNLRNGMSYGYLIQILSMGLIAFGVSYKVLLKSVVKTEEEETTSKEYSDSEYNDNSRHRILAPSSTDVSTDAIVALFTGSLSIVIFSLELMMLTHCGIKKAIGRLFQGEGNGRKVYWPMAYISTFKVAVLLFAVTLDRWVSDPATLVLSGFGIVASLAVTRILGWGIIHHKAIVNQAAQLVTENVKKLGKTMSFAPSISAQGKEALEAANPTPSDGLSEKASDSGSASLKSGVSGADLVNIGINNAFDAIIVSDLNGIIKQVNATAVDIFRYSTKEEMIGKNLTILVGGGEGKNHDAYVRAFKKKNHSKSSKVLGQQRVLQARRADGTEFACIIGIKTCANNTRIVGYIRDMTTMLTDEKSKMTADIDESDAIGSVVDDHAFDAIIACDKNGTIKGANAAALTEFGYASKMDILAQNVSTLIHGVVTHPEMLQDSHGEQRVVTLTRQDNTDFQAIFSVRKIQGTANMVALYVRNLDHIKYTFKCNKCD